MMDWESALMDEGRDISPVCTCADPPVKQNVEGEVHPWQVCPGCEFAFGRLRPWGLEPFEAEAGPVRGPGLERINPWAVLHQIAERAEFKLPDRLPRPREI